MRYKIARQSILGIEWFYPAMRQISTDWTFSGHTLDHRFSSRKDAVKTAKELLEEEARRENPNKIFVAEWKDGKWKFIEVKA